MQVTRVAPDGPVPDLMHRRRVLGDRITYVGLDVHKDGIVVAVAEGGIRGEVREYGRIANTAGALDRLMRKLGGEGVGLRFCYEAGPCGYGIQRHLSAHGHDCVVVAPSLIPKRAGDRVKTDRRDAASLARLHRAGELTAVWVPDAGHEAMRDLVRARLDAVHALRRARQQLSGFLLRQGCHYGRPAWTKLHRPHGTSPWAEGSRLAGLKFEQAVHHLVLEDYVQAVEAAAARRDRLTAQIEAMLPDWTLAPVVAALQTMRGMALVNAATLIAELGDLSRFANPRQLMAYLGLVPSEYSSGASIKRGGLTKAGNSATRRLLIEASWTYRFPARVSRELLLRQEGQSKPIREIAWKAQLRLCARYRKLAHRGKPANVVTAAIARELAGFIWAIARRVPPTAG
jgi:transposase